MWATTFHFQGNKLYPRAHSPTLSYTNDCSWRSYRSFFFLFLINDIFFFFCLWNERDFLRNECTQAGTTTLSPHCNEKEKKKKHSPNCDLNAEIWPEAQLLWNVPPQTQLVPFATNEKKNAFLRDYCFFRMKQICQYIHNEVNLFIFLWIVVYINTRRYLLKWLGWMEVILYFSLLPLVLIIGYVRVCHLCFLGLKSLFMLSP